jgi:predicted nuclease of predicted toxin-antitoxin system
VIVWLDAHLSPRIANWMSATFEVQAVHVRDMGLQSATDLEIFMAARRVDAIVVTKDADFRTLLSKHGPPPRVVWLTCGNTSTTRLKELLRRSLPRALDLTSRGEMLVQITGGR